MSIRLNEREIGMEAGMTLFRLRDQWKPDADVLVHNGAAVTDDVALNDGDSVSLIRRGEIPPAEELEALMAAHPC